MKQLFFFVVLILLQQLMACNKCKECVYYEEVDNEVVLTDTLEGEYCGDEYRAVESKDYYVIKGEAYVKCI